MKPPCEIVVWYIIPGIRSVLSKELFKLNMRQKDISELLEITQPAISQYLSDKRGNEIEFNDEICKMIRELAIGLKKGEISKIDMIPEMCQICRKVKSEDLMCYLHKEKGSAPEKCMACLKDDQSEVCVIN
ncbi:MAG: transcriptional regulator [Methanobacteriaceae archaeon]|nr:transcriptional regulator [Candidatus Methanorudis spinitermitis]